IKIDMGMIISRVYNFKRDCDSIANWAEMASALYDQLNDQRGKGDVYYQRAYAAFCRMAYEEAMDQIMSGLKIMEDLEDDAGIALGHLRMARIFHFTFKMAQSAEYGKLAAQRFERLKDYPNAWDSWSFAGHGYRMENDSLQALACFDKGRSMALQSGIPAIEGMAYNDLAAFFMEYEMYDSAAIYYQKALDLVKPEDERQVMVIKNGLGQVYLHTGQYQKCIDLLSEAMTVVKKTGDTFFLTELPEYIGQSYAALGQYDSAYKYMELNWRFSDSLFTVNQDKALEEMKTKYESDQKDALIALRESERKYIFAILIAVSVLAFMIYRRYISKKRTTEILNQRNKEKDFLLREIHHRVKNNLQILSSLLNLQQEYIKDESALNALIEGRNRVQSMALIHQQLYSDTNIVAVDMRQYIGELCEHLSDSFTTLEKSVTIKSDILPDLFDVETAIPLGLIVNELITNSIKYAFSDRNQGTIKVKLWKGDTGKLCLSVSDDGKGLSHPDQATTHHSFGTDLIKMLSNKLKGNIELDTANGYTTIITFERYKIVDPDFINKHSVLN
ncbi:MAG: hypothetical protein HKN76_17205, partial [Saprospiraceae bacterium]|nr:hypothetical protein [Saprospiraceae bacterium]